MQRGRENMDIKPGAHLSERGAEKQKWAHITIFTHYDFFVILSVGEGCRSKNLEKKNANWIIFVFTESENVTCDFCQYFKLVVQKTI